MKKTIMGFSLYVILARCLSVQADVERVKLSVLGKYIDVGKMLRKAFFLGGSPSNDAIIEMLVDSVKVGELPIEVTGDPNATIQDYFETSKAKEFIRKVLTDVANKSLSAENFGKHLGTLQAGIFKGKKGVPAHVGQNGAQNTVHFINNLKGYFASGMYQELGFFDFVEANEGIPPFLDTLTQGYFDLKGARSLIENPSQISVDTIFAYISFEQLFRDKPNKQLMSKDLNFRLRTL